MPRTSPSHPLFQLALLATAFFGALKVQASPPDPAFNAPQVLTGFGHQVAKVVGSIVYSSTNSANVAVDKRTYLSFTHTTTRDVAIADNTSHTVIIKRGPLGTSALADVSLSVGTALITDMVVADLNSDELPDVIVCAGGQVLVFINTFDHSTQTNPSQTLTFAAPVTYTANDPADGTTALNLVSVATLSVDLTEGSTVPPDVIAGAAAGNPSDSSDRHGFLAHFINPHNPDGALGTTPDVFRTTRGISMIATGDLNNDGYTDIVTGDAPTGRLQVILNADGGANTRTIDPSVTTPVTYFSSGFLSAIAVGDTDADGGRDVYALNGSSSFSGNSPTFSSTLNAFHNLNDGTGSLTSATGQQLKNVTTTDVTGVVGNIAIGDLNGDGTTGEIAVADGLDDLITFVTVDPALVALNHGSLFGHLTTMTGGTRPRYVEIGDFNGDGTKDLFLANTDDTVPGGLYLNGSGTSGPASVHVEFATDGETITEGGTASIVVNRGSATSGAFTVAFSVGGTATANNGANRAVADYTVDTTDTAIRFNPARRTGTISFTAADHTKTIKVSLAASTTPEINETVTFLMGTITPFTAVAGDVKLNTLTIKDNTKPTVRAPGPLAVVASNFIRHTAAELRSFGIAAVARTNNDWTFTVVQPGDANALALKDTLSVKVQYSLTPTHDTWTDLLTLATTRGGVYTGKTSDVPVGQKVYFRTVTAADNLVSAIGTPTAAYNVIAAPKLNLTITQASRGDSSNPANFNTGGVTTYNSDEVHYKLKIENAGNDTATNAVVTIPLSAFADAYGRPTALKNHFEAATASLISAGSMKMLDRAGRVTTNPGDTVAVQYSYTHLAVGDADFMEVVMGTLSAAEYYRPDQTASFGKKIVMSGIDVSAIDQGVSHLPSVPPSLAGVVNNPLEVRVAITTTTDSNNIANTGGRIQYEFALNNHANFDFTGVSFTDKVPIGTALYGVNNQNSSGDFTALPINMTPSTSGNPAVPLFHYGQQQELKWTVGTIPARSTRTIRYTVQVLNDLPSYTYDSAGQYQGTEVNNVGYDVTATPPTGGVIHAYKNAATDAPRTRTLITADSPQDAPRIRFEKRAVSEGGNAGGEIRTLTSRVPVDLPTVLPNDPVKYTLYYKNFSYSTALSCVIQDQIADGATFTGFVSINGHDPTPDEYIFYTADGTVLPRPGFTLAHDIVYAKVVEFHVHNLGALAEGTVTYKAAATVPAGRIMVANDARMWTANLLAPVKCSPAVAPVQVVQPITFEKETRADKASVAGGDTLTYTITYRNNGGVSSFNSALTIPIPAGTTYIDGSAIPINNAGDQIYGYGDPTPPTRANRYVLTFPNTGEMLANEHRAVRFKVKINPLAGALLLPGASFKCNPLIQGYYKTGIAASHPYSGRVAADAQRLVGVVGTADELLTPVKLATTSPHLWALKTYPNFVFSGQEMVYQLAWGNTGDTAFPGIQASIQVPFGTELVAADTTPGYSYRSGIVTWNFPALAGHGAGSCLLAVRVNKSVVFKNDTIEEASAYVAPSNAITTAGVVPGPANTLVLSTSPVVAAWQEFGALLRGIGANLYGNSSSALDQAVQNLKGTAVSTTIRGADVITLTNGILLVPNLGGQLIAAGAGNLVGNAGGTLVGNAGGTLIAAGAGNVIVSGSALTIPGAGLCNTAGLLDLVQNKLIAAGAGNLIAAGAGNLISNDGAGLISNDGAGVIASDGAGVFSIDGGNLLPIGGGNLIAAGAGNFIAAGGGSLIAAGAGNLKENLLSSRAGIVTVINGSGSGFISVGRVIARDGAGLIPQDGAGLLQTSSGLGLVPQTSNLFNGGASNLAPKGQ